MLENLSIFWFQAQIVHWQKSGQIIKIWPVEYWKNFHFSFNFRDKLKLQIQFLQALLSVFLSMNFPFLRIMTKFSSSSLYYWMELFHRSYLLNEKIREKKNKFEQKMFPKMKILEWLIGWSDHGRFFFP